MDSRASTAVYVLPIPRRGVRQADRSGPEQGRWRMIADAASGALLFAVLGWEVLRFGGALRQLVAQLAGGGCLF